MIAGICPKCGKKLQIPAELEQFSCLYCGAKLSRSVLLPEPKAVRPVSEDAAGCYRFVEENLLRCVADYPESFKMITKKDFSPFSDRYMAECRSVFEQLEQCAVYDPENRESYACRAAASLMAQLQDWFPRQKGWNSFRKKDIVDGAKFTIAIFLVPMLDRLHLSVGPTFCQELRRLWMEAYPKSPFHLAGYDDLANGFRKRRFCFITTAVCQSEGKPDDCAELTAFRAFRDQYLAACPDGPALIEEYYAIAPAIVMAIDYCTADAGAAYAAIRRDYLRPCYETLRAGDLAGCKRTYVQMVRALQRQYLGS